MTTIVTTRDKAKFVVDMKAQYVAPYWYIPYGSPEETFAIDKSNKLVCFQFLSQTAGLSTSVDYEVIEEYTNAAFQAKYNQLSDADYQLVGPVQSLIKEDNIQVFCALMMKATL